MIVDSFAWIEFLGGTSLEPAIRRQLAAADMVATPDLVLAEVARKLARDGITRAIAGRKLRDISTLSDILPRTSSGASFPLHRATAEASGGSRFNDRTRRPLRGGGGPVSTGVNSPVPPGTRASARARTFLAAFKSRSRRRPHRHAYVRSFNVRGGSWSRPQLEQVCVVPFVGTSTYRPDRRASL